MLRFEIFALVITIICSISPVFAATQPLAQLTISVIDAGNSPIAGAIVELIAQRGLSSGGQQNHGAIRIKLRCDSDGQCVANEIPAGNYTVEVRTASAVAVLKDPIMLAPGKLQHFVIRVNGATAALILSLGTIRVTPTGTLATVSAPSTELSGETLAERGAQNFVEALAEQPGVTLNRPNGVAAAVPVSIILRGSDPKETIVQIDGHSINNSNSGDFDVSLLDPSAFSSLQILYGLAPASLVGANTEGGTINFHTLEPTAVPHGLLRFTLGGFATHGYTFVATGSTSRLGYALEFHGYNQQGEITDYPVVDAATGQLATLGTGISGSNALVKFRYTVPSDTTFEASMLTLGSNRDLSAALSTPVDRNDVSPGARFTSYAGSQRNNANAFYDADLRFPLGARSSHSAPSAFLTLRHMTSFGEQNVGGPANGLSEYLLNNTDVLDENSIEYERLLAGADLTLVARFNTEGLTTADQFGDSSPTQAQRWRYILARYMWKGGARLQYITAAYYSYFSTCGANLSPRAGIVWTPTQQTVVRASLGSGFQAPLLTEKVVPSPLPPPDVNGLVNVGNPNLQADYTTEYELDAEHLLGSGSNAVTGEADLYHIGQRGDDLQFIPSGASLANPKLSYPVNLARSIWQGAAFKLDVPLKSGMAVAASYNINQTYPLALPRTLQDESGNLVPFQQFQNVPMHRASLSLRLQSRSLSWMLGMSFEGNNNDLNRPSFATVNANVKYSWGHTDFVISAGNLTSVYADKFTLAGAGVPYPGVNGPISTDAYSLQAPSAIATITQRW